VPKKNNPGCNCCTVTCNPDLSDDFTRADSTSMGGTWSEVAQNWSIESNAAVCAAANGLLASTSTSLGDADQVQMHVALNFDTVGDIARGIIGYVDTSNYYFAEVRVTEDLVFLRLGQRVSGTTTYLTNEAAQIEDAGVWGKGEDFILRICYDRTTDELKANTYTTEGAMIGQFSTATVTLPATYAIGLATVTQTGQINFLSVDFYPCGTCSNRCEVVDDDFNRSTVGENWDVRSGAFSTTWDGVSASGVLNANSANSLLICKSFLSEFPESINDYAQVTQATVTLFPGGSIILVCGYQNDSNYYFARYDLSTDGKTETLRLYIRNGGSNVQLGSNLTARTYVTGQTSVTNVMRLCYTSFGVTIELQTGHRIEVANATRTGMQAGIGTFSSTGNTTATFFTYGILGSDTGYGETFPAGSCRTCTPSCSSCHATYPAPLEMEIDIGTGWTDNTCDCDSIPGVYILRYTGGCCWRYVRNNFCVYTRCSTTNAVHQLNVTLCVATSGSNLVWTLTVSTSVTGGTIDPCSPVETIYQATVAKTDDGCQNPPASLALTATNNLVATISGVKVCNGTSPATVGLTAL
jgi:hypothetical protein